MQVSTTRHSSRTSVESTAGLASPGSRVASDLATCSGDVSGGSISDESVNAAVTIGSGSCEAGVASAAAVSVTDLLAATASAAANEIGGSLSANLATTVRDGAGRSTIGAAPVLSIPAEPNAAIQARTEAGIATSWHHAATAANRGFMITVSHGAGLHSQESDANDFWSHDMDNQWRKPRIQFLKGGVAQMQRAFRYPPESISPATASTTSTSVHNAPSAPRSVDDSRSGSRSRCYSITRRPSQSPEYWITRFRFRG
jgi:hypothetical protein